MQTETTETSRRSRGSNRLQRSRPRPTDPPDWSALDARRGPAVAALLWRASTAGASSRSLVEPRGGARGGDRVRVRLCELDARDLRERPLRNPGHAHLKRQPTLRDVRPDGVHLGPHRRRGQRGPGLIALRSRSSGLELGGRRLGLPHPHGRQERDARATPRRARRRRRGAECPAVTATACGGAGRAGATTAGGLLLGGGGGASGGVPMLALNEQAIAAPKPTMATTKAVVERLRMSICGRTLQLPSDVVNEAGTGECPSEMG